MESVQWYLGSWYIISLLMLFVGTPASLLAARYCPRWKPEARIPEEVSDVRVLPEGSQEDIAPVRAPSSLADPSQRPEESEGVSDETPVEATAGNEIRQSSNLTGQRWERLEGDVRQRETRAAGYVPWTATWASAKPGRDPLVGPSRSSSFGPKTGGETLSEGSDLMQAPLVAPSGVKAPSDESVEPQKKQDQQPGESDSGNGKRNRGPAHSRNQLWGALARASAWRKDAIGGRTFPHK